MCVSLQSAGPRVVTQAAASPVGSCLAPAVRVLFKAMLPPRLLPTTKRPQSRGPGLLGLGGALPQEPTATVGPAAPDSDLSHQRFRNLRYLESAGPRTVLVQLRNLCINWLQPQTRTKEEIIDLLVLEQYLTILPQTVSPWVRARKPENCEKLVALLENYRKMFEPEEDEVLSDDEFSPVGAESPPPRSVHSFYSKYPWLLVQGTHLEPLRAWDMTDGASDTLARPLEDDRNRRGRSRDLRSRDHWPYMRTSRNRPQRDLSLPLMENNTFAMERDDDSDRGSMMDFGTEEAESYQDVVDLSEDRKPQNPIQDNMENYRKLLSLGVQLAEDDGHSHLTHGHSSRSKRSAYPSTSRGQRSMSEARNSAYRRGICEQESSHGMIMEKFIRDVSPNSRSGRAREPPYQPQRFPRMPDSSDDWSSVSFSKRESVIQERGCEGSVTGGGFSFNSTFVSQKRVLERKRRSQPDTDGKGCDQKGYVRKKPLECSEMRKAVSLSCLGSLDPGPEAQAQARAQADLLAADLAAKPYVCDECGQPFSEISKFVEHQIMHTRENLCEYGESFIHSVAVSEFRKKLAAEKHAAAKEASCQSTAVSENRNAHVGEGLLQGQDQEYEDIIIPSPTLNELQKMYGKKKFYECKVCQETFFHSSALADHQKTHGRGSFSDDTDNKRGETCKPSSVLAQLQRAYGKEKKHECKVCGETFLHSSALKEHQKSHARDKNLFENQGRALEETFIPGQPRKRHQKTHAREQLCEFKDGGEAFIQSKDLSCGKNLYEGRAYQKSVIHNMPFTQSQKSHTITRPPDQEECEPAITISANPKELSLPTAKESVGGGRQCERSVIHRLAFTDPQKSHNAEELTKPKLMAELTSGHSTDTMEHQRARSRECARSRERACAELACGRSVIQSLAAAEPPRRHSGSELARCSAGGESSSCSSDPEGRQITTRGHPFQEAKYNKYTVIHSVSYVKPQRSLSGEGPGALKREAEPSATVSHAHEHQKARAKKKYLECRDSEPFFFGEPQSSYPRERPYRCQECGESFVRSKDLTEHQKIHCREKPSASKIYSRSVIRSLAGGDPQTSYASEERVHYECRQCRKCFPTGEALSRHQKIFSRDRFHGHSPFGSSVNQGVGFEEPQKEDSGDTIYECKDCGLSFADFSDFGDHQKVHGRDYLMDNRACGPSVIQTCSFGESQRNSDGDQLFECPQCGESFINNEFLFEHQKMHEREPFFVSRQYHEASLRLGPFHIPKRRRSSRKTSTVTRALRCTVCGQDFIHNSSLHEHMKIHTGEDQLEQGRMGEGPTASGLALTQFQRSQTEERSYECKTCSECFLSHTDLSDHMRVHERDDRGDGDHGAVRFAYGGTFVHTLFPSGRPGPRSPFFECKDCGKSFIHNTILVKHQQLHLEEAAQEVEANVVVPQEVLRIQGSNVEAAEPEVEAAEPEVEAAEPEVEAAEPNGDAEGPEGEIAEPDEAQQPEAEAEQPIIEDDDADEPDGVGIEDPEERAEEPEGDADEPDGPGIEDPEEEEQEVPPEELIYDCGECGETFLSTAAYREHLQDHSRVIVYEPGFEGQPAFEGESAGPSEDRAQDHYFKCDVCGLLFTDLEALAGHQSSHTG
ncbi:paternally-expressed gene 3 protein [Rhynchocyon petersi]